MNSIKDFIESGVLELYVMGAASPEEAAAVEQMAASHPEVQQEIDAISEQMEVYAMAHAVKPRNTVKTLVLATIDYLERMKEGELPTSPPVLTAQSRPEDFAPWLNREDMVLPADAEGVYAKIIGYTPVATTAVIWLKDATEQEVHHDEYERFLILEGTCEITAGENVYSLAAGDYFAVPLHTPHHFKVISTERCKAVLQRLSVEA
ncbi:cupin domain-containing protein [Pontibacter toksunensis]|uniref:Cupin domain-containing protein n=1 Tax=Pontibacter toksunensis TaxID=1332631 RepID=A0ABW6BY44_9BACT